MLNKEELKKEWIEREERLHNWGVWVHVEGDDDLLWDWVISKIDKAVEETKKAFGGCDKCYGKGYHTNLDAWSGTDEWSGKRYSQQTPYYNPCTCDRGRQIAELQNKVVADKVKEVRDAIQRHNQTNTYEHDEEAVFRTTIKEILSLQSLQINNNKDIE